MKTTMYPVNSFISSMRLPILFLTLLVLMTVAFAKTPEGFKSTWEDVQKSARERHVLIYLHFTTDWCGWCRKIESETYTDAKVKQELATNFAAASLDCTVPEGKKPSDAVNTNNKLFSKYGGSGYPFLVVLSEDGSTVYQIISGYMPANDFLQKLQEAKKTEKDYLAFQEYAKKADKTTYEYNLRAMQMMTRINRESDAIANAKKICELDPDNAKGNLLEAAWIVLQNTQIDKWNTDGKVYMDIINKFDADNTKRYMEQATWVQALTAFNQKEFTKCISSMEGLIKAAKTLENGQDIYGVLGIAYFESGNKEKGAKNLETAIKLNPSSRRGKWLQEKLDVYKNKK